MNVRLLWKVLPVLACASLVAFADPTPLDTYGNWVEQYQAMGASGGYFASTYTAVESGAVDITGYYENTDQYNVYLNGTLTLTTPAISGPAVDYGDNAGTYMDASNEAFSSGLFSAGTFNVMSGDLISIQDIGPLFPSTAGSGFDAQVGLQATPEPATSGFFVMGLGTVAFYIRKRKVKA